MIDPKSAWALYAECEVFYSGRAFSSLLRGHYLIIHKADGTLLVHSSIKNPPRNYQGPGAKLTIDNNIIISSRKSEVIKIIVYRIINYMPLSGWSSHVVDISNTEKDLVQKLFDNWHDYFEGDFEIIYTEYPTDNGPIDILGIDAADVFHAVEVKRKTAVLSHCSQLNRYLETFQEQDIKVVGCVASPKISKNALAYLEKHGHRWIQINFDEHH